MATRTVGVLSIDLVGNIGGFEKSMRRATGSANAFVKTVTVGFNSVSASLSRMAGPLAAFLSVRQVAQYAQAWTELNNRLKLVTATNQDLAQSSKDIYAIAQQTGQALAGTSEVYSRIAKNATTYGLSLQDVAKITDTVSKSVAISGTSAESAAAGLMQFGQALASQRLGGEELNSILEQTPGLALAIAKGLGVPVGALKEMGKQGKLTGDAVVAALQKAAGFIDTQFSNITLTASQNQQRLNNALERYVGMLDTELGGSVAFGDLMNSITGYIEDQTEKIDDLIVDIDWLVDQYDRITTEIGDFWRNVTEGLPGVGEETNATASVMERSFADFAVATLAEFQNLLNGIAGVFAALDGANQSVTYNLGVAFENAFLWIKKTAVDAINEIIGALNQLGNIEIFGQKMGVNIKKLDAVKGEYKEFSNVLTDLQRGFENGANTFTFADAAKNSLEARRNLEWISRNYGGDGVGDGSRRDIDTGSIGGISGAGGKGKKKRAGKSDAEKAFAREQKQFADWIKRQKERIALLGTETELEKIQAEFRLGNWSKLSKAQQEEMLQLAALVDLEEKRFEIQERAKELSGFNVYKDNFKDVEALNLAYQQGQMSLDAYNLALVRIGQSDAAERLAQGFGTLSDVITVSFGKILEGFHGLESGASDLLGTIGGDAIDGFADSIGRAIVYSENFGEAMRDLAKNTLAELISGMVKLGIQYLLFKAIGESMAKDAVTNNSILASETAAAWAPAAAAVSLATLGANGVPAAAAIVGTNLLSMGFAKAGFAEGGYTGPGGKYKIAGPAHAGEYIFNAQRVREIGLDNLRRLDETGGFADGGYVSTSPVSGAVASLSSGASTGEIQIVNNTRGRIDSAEQSTSPTGQRIITLKENEDYIASRIADPNSKISRAIGKNTHAKRRF